MYELDDKPAFANSDLPNTSIIYTLLAGMAYTLTGTLSLLFSPSGTKALMRQFIYTLSVGMAYTLTGTLALY